MSLNDPLSNTLSKIMNAEKIGKKEVVIKPSSKVIKKVLDILNKKGFIGDYEEVKDIKGNYLKVNLLGNINKCGAIKPRYTIDKTGYEKFEKRYLPASGFGIIIISTNQDLLVHEEAKKKNIGGRLIAYCY